MSIPASFIMKFTKALRIGGSLRCASLIYSDFFLQTLEQNNKQGAELLLPRCFKIKEKNHIRNSAAVRCV